MSQKIVIKTQMKEPTPTPRSVEYQWHWRRVVVALGCSVTLLAAGVYGIFSAIKTVNAEEALPTSTRSDSTISKPFDSVPTITVKTVTVPSEGESFIAPLGEDESIKSQVAGVANVSQGNTESMTLDNDEQLEVVQSNNEQRQVESQANSFDDTAQVKQVTTPETQGAQSENVLETNRFSNQAQVASVALDAQIDMQFVSRAVLTSNVSAREPVNVLSELVYTSDFEERLYFFTEIKNLPNQTVSHLWFHQDQLMAEIPLTISAIRYRTYSNKHVAPSQTGEWRVEAVTSNGTLIAQKSFRILESTQP